MKTVEFIRVNPPYRKGEQAGFDDVTADRMVQSGAARHVATLAEALAAQPSDEINPPLPPAREAVIQAGYRRKG